MTRCCINHRIVRVGETRGLILEAGSSERAPTVVIVASTLVLARSYLWTLIEFARRFRTVVVESPGTGRASHVGSPWTLEQYARWTGQLLDVLGLENVTLVGHSVSGAIGAILAAQEHPRLRRLVLADTIGADRSLSLMRVLFARAIDCSYEPELSITAWHHVLLNAVFHFRNFFEQVRLSARTDLREVAPRVRLPTLIAWGARDHTMPLRCARLLHERIPDSRLYVSRWGSHDWLNDHPDEFAEVLDRFIRET